MATVPELDPAAVARWHKSGGQLVDLLTEAKRLGGVSAFRVGDRRMVLVTEPRAVQHVLAQHPERYVKRSHRLRVLVGDGVVAAEGEQWRKQRKVLQAQFTGQGVRRYDELMAASAAQTVQRWADSARAGEPRDLDADMRHFSFDIIWRCMTGRPLDDTTHREFLAANKVLNELPAFAPATGGTKLDMDAEVAQVDVVAERAIAAARDSAGPSLLHVLLTAADEHPEYTDRLIRDELVTLLGAGYETSATTLTWLFQLLQDNPAVLDWLLAASDRTEAIRAVLNETMRLYPVVWIMPRYAAEDDDLVGYPIEADTPILTSAYLTHRDPSVWTDPDEFRPQRFIDNRERLAPGTFYPFGLGPRTCLGMQFALREMTVLLEALLPAFTVNVDTVGVEPKFGVILRPDRELVATVKAR